MSDRNLAPYGSKENAALTAKAGKGPGKAITPTGLVARMPSAEIASKVGGPIKQLTPANLASRMPSAEVAAKVGELGISTKRAKIVRRSAQN